MGIDQSTLNLALSNPKIALNSLDKFESEQSLFNFMTLAWPSIEPGIEFVPNWTVQALCDHLEAVTSGQIRRLLINIPPGFSKSLTLNVFFPAWEWGPKKLTHYRYISFAHEQKLAMRDNVRCRDLVQQEWYQSIWGDQFSFKSDQNAKIYYENDKTGWRQACAASSLTGRRGDRVIADDPHSVDGADSELKREEVLRIFAETVPTRLNKQAESAIIVIMQRVHERDVSGLILAEELGYEHLMLPMEFEANRRCYSIIKPSYIKDPKKKLVYFNEEEKAWGIEKPNQEGEIKRERRYNVDIRKKDGELLDPVRFPRKSVEDLKKALSSWGGTYAEIGQLQQRPAPRGGGMFKKADFQIIDNLNGLTGRVVRGWDFAASVKSTSPYTAGVKMMLTTDRRIIVVNSNRFRKLPGALEDEIKLTCEMDGYEVNQDMPQDPGQAGKTQKIALMKMLHGFIVNFSTESGSKENRALPFAAQVESGNVYLLRGSWNNDYINEASLFPAGQYKDQIDASSRAYSALIRKKTKTIPAAPALLSG